VAAGVWAGGEDGDGGGRLGERVERTVAMAGTPGQERMVRSLDNSQHSIDFLFLKKNYILLYRLLTLAVLRF
jgi:hypothetical protein